jgi:drug/metabolite transporter (DMT)-like permease
MTWYVLALIALVCYGILNFLYKVSAENRCNTAWTYLSFMCTAAGLSWFFSLFGGERLEDLSLLLILALLNAVTYSAATIAKTEALKYAAAGIIFPITRMSTAVVVLFSVIYLKEALSATQGLGILLVIAVFFILTQDSQGYRGSNLGRGIKLAVLSVFATAVSSIVCKYAASNFSGLFKFIALSYTLNILIALALRERLQGEAETSCRMPALLIGFFIGIFNLLGFYALLRAMAIGPLAVISPISSMSFVIAVGLSVVFYREPLPPQRIIGILGAVAAVLLLKG